MDGEPQPDTNTALNDTAPHVLLSQFLRENNWTQDHFAKLTGYSRQTVNLILNGKQPISAKLSKKFGMVTGNVPEYWANLQLQYDLHSHTDDASTPPLPLTSLTSESFIKPGVLADHQIEAEIISGNLSIEPFTTIHLQPASYDLTIECAVSNGEKIDVLLPGQNAHVMAHEVIGLSLFYTARFGPCSKVTRHGIGVFTGCQIDPGYKGKLVATVHNFSEKPYPIPKGETFLTVEFTKMSGTPRRGYTGQFLNEDGIPEDTLAVFLDHVPSFDYDESSGLLTIRRLHDNSYVLCAPIKAGVQEENGQYVVKLDEFGVSCTETSSHDLYEKLSQLIVHRYHALSGRKDRLAPELKEQLKTLQALLNCSADKPASQFRRLAQNLGVHLDAADEILDDVEIEYNGQIIALLTPPKPGETVSTHELATALGVTEDFVNMVIHGKKDLHDLVKFHDLG